MIRTLWVLALGAVLSCLPLSAQAGLVSQDSAAVSQVGRTAPGSEVLEAHEYRLPERRVAGQESVRQSVTAWEVTSGSWNGVNLQGLSLVLVHSKSDTGPSDGTINCYVSHVATTAQRNALVSAYAAAQAVPSTAVRNWRIEPAVISFEVAGQRVILHLGLVA
jgi:hypothetical protein